MSLSLSPVDVAIVALAGIAMWNGFRSGFIATTYGLATWVISFAAGFAFQQPATALVGQLGLTAAVARPIAFIAVILAAEALFSLAGFVAIAPIVRIVHRLPAVAVVDRLLGIVPSTVRALFVMGIALAAFVVSPIGSEAKVAVESSRLARALIGEITALQPQLATLSGQLIADSPLFVTKLGADQTEKLDLPDGLTLTNDPAAERQMLDLVNEERTSRGLAALQLDDRLVPVARQHSEEMFRLKYFSHQSPVSGSPFDRLKAAGIKYSAAGENLAYAQALIVAHRGLMDSEGHRENILRPEFTRIGIGVVSAGPYGLMFTQLFLTP